MQKIAVIISIFLLTVSGTSIICTKSIETVDEIKNDINNNYSEAFIGYTVIASLSEKYQPFLIDMDGNVLHIWKNLSDSVIVLPDGSAVGPSNTRDDYIFGREYCNMIQEEWNGSIVWNFSNWDDENTGTMMARQHHDFQRQGNPVGYYAPGQKFVTNGTTLVLAHKNENKKEVSKHEIVDDVIYEVDWSGNFTDFEWHASDHIDAMGFNYLSRLGIYFFPGSNILWHTLDMEDVWFLKSSWLHTNSMSRLGENKWYEAGDERFNPGNIIINSRHSRIIMIISRETGEIVWKVGPNYSPNTKEGKMLKGLVGQHHAHMIPKGLPGEGNILVFDNGGFAGYGLSGMPNHFRTYSRVIEFNPVTLEIEWEYTHRNGSYLIPSGENHKFFSPFTSSAQRLPNGNTLITEGNCKRIFEVNKDKEIVWEYIFEYGSLYRAYRVPPEWIPGNPAGYDFWEQ